MKNKIIVLLLTTVFASQVFAQSAEDIAQSNRSAGLGLEATLRSVRAGDAVELRRPEHVPLLTERIRVGRLRNEAGDPPQDRVDLPRLDGRERSLLDPRALVPGDVQLEHSTRAWFGQEVDEAFVHATSLLAAGRERG